MYLLYICIVLIVITVFIVLIVCMYCTYCNYCIYCTYCIYVLYLLYKHFNGKKIINCCTVNAVNRARDMARARAKGYRARLAETLGGLSEDSIHTIRAIGRDIGLRLSAPNPSISSKHLFGRGVAMPACGYTATQLFYFYFFYFFYIFFYYTRKRIVGILKTKQKNNKKTKIKN